MALPVLTFDMRLDGDSALDCLQLLTQTKVCECEWLNLMCNSSLTSLSSRSFAGLFKQQPACKQCQLHLLVILRCVISTN